MKLAKKQETEGLIHFRARQNHIANRGVARAGPRPKLGCGFNLHAQVWRSVQQDPMIWGCTASELSLRARSTKDGAVPHAAAVHTRTIPLWKATARRAAQYFYLHSQGSLKEALK